MHSIARQKLKKMAEDRNNWRRSTRGWSSAAANPRTGW